MILASKSPSRRKILSDFGYSFSVEPSDFEEIFDSSMTASQNAIRLAEGKAYEVFAKFPQENVFGMDSIMIDPNGKLLEKPINREDAKKMMQTRSGKIEILISALCLLTPEKKFSQSEETLIYWKDFSDQDIERILDTNEWEGKCGGIAIEGFTGLFIKRIDGNYQNVMGFPLNCFWNALALQ